MTDSQKFQRHTGIGNILIRLSGSVLLLSSLVKISHLKGPVAYMSFLGYEGEKLYLIAGLEILIGVLFLVQATRSAGLLLLSSYMGGAIAAHFAWHPLNSSVWIVMFMFHHPYVETLPAALVLFSAWIGVLFRHPEAFAGFRTLDIRSSKDKGQNAIRTAA